MTNPSFSAVQRPIQVFISCTRFSKSASSLDTLTGWSPPLTAQSPAKTWRRLDRSARVHGPLEEKTIESLRKSKKNLTGFRCFLVCIYQPNAPVHSCNSFPAWRWMVARRKAIATSSLGRYTGIRGRLKNLRGRANFLVVAATVALPHCPSASLLHLFFDVSLRLARPVAEVLDASECDELNLSQA